ncbi:argininosuccinate lyase isoform X2 [Nasonia vitripennis]|uniref:Argininosuccinate lyase n=1 Tax=Nasonia vitripennis TaxID=7425 RepID=A0A7M7TAX9_NASVI|nr:argininosuccinate lyase isoform X2 [Nasonia vitripennis]
MYLSFKSQKLWGGRFVTGIDPTLNKINASIHIDKRMYVEDIQASIAYAEALSKAKLLTDIENELIENGLKQILKEWENNDFALTPDDEDIHTAVERRLTELIGDTARKLHTGRSRNDQCITDTKLWLRKSIDYLIETLVDVIQVMTLRAEENINVIMPGYTHLQRAQPIRWSHWLLSYAWSLKNDANKLKQMRKNVNVMPLGSGALAGNPFDIDREALATSLGFDGATENSMHAVGDRDFIADFLYWTSLTSMHLSRFAEDVIIYSSQEFDFLKISDSFSTGSSLMPHKRNPDSMELIRGKSGTMLGKCVGFLTTLKGIPSTYNKDLQEDKEALFTAYDTVTDLLVVARETIKTLEVNSDKCRAALTLNMLATDLAYYLVRKGIPFRNAHHIVGQIICATETEKIPIKEFPVSKLKNFSPVFDEDVKNIWNFESSVEQYKTCGGTSLAAVQQQIDTLNNWLSQSNSKQYNEL